MPWLQLPVIIASIPPHARATSRQLITLAWTFACLCRVLLQVIATIAFGMERRPAIRHLARFSAFPVLLVAAAAAGTAGTSAVPFAVTSSCFHFATSAVAGALRTAESIHHVMQPQTAPRRARRSLGTEQSLTTATRSSSTQVSASAMGP